ncbi:NAD(P)-dependent oxidoreductase [Candidatus Pelagibacter sp.]|nr:NAD(P)-dependent oxidoreductase [Candidatus Pelagibacter sp.]
MSRLKNKKIAIVGGLGFIGHNLAIQLKKLGAKVAILDGMSVNSFSSVIANSDNIPNNEMSLKILNSRIDELNKNKIQLHCLDARDYNALSVKLLMGIKADVVIHLAAVSHANRSLKDPFSTFDHSLRTLENTLDICKNKKIQQLIFLSSSMIYGNFKKKVIKENDLCDPIDIYGTLKYMAEKLIKIYQKVFGINYTIIRPSALYGERCISRRVSQVFIEHAIKNQEITIQGDGKDKLDFTYIDDLCQGIIKSVLNKKAYNQTFNITFGNGREINDLIKILKNFFPNIKVKFKPRNKFMPKRGALSNSKARKLLGFKPQWKLEQGYKNYIKWYRDLFSKN